MGFKHLFQPLTLRHRTLKNRVVFGAHTTNMAEDGLPGARHLAYYEERARGGAAMIVVEPMPVHDAAVLTRGNFRHGDDAVIPHFRRLTEACQAHGTVMIQQLYHVGAHGDWDNAWHPGWSPSGGVSYHDNDGSHPMTEAEIAETIEGFVAAARRCQAAGFDGVELWAAYHCLVDQFWTPFSNTRTDGWGEDLDGRTRFSREVLRRIRAECGEDFIIGLSVSDNPGVEVALGRDDMVEILARHDADGLMDYVTVGSGSYFDFSSILPTFPYGEKLTVDLTTRLKQALRHAIVTAESHIRTPENANTVLGAGEADLVSIVRGQIADPYLVSKAAENRAEDIRSCLSCNQQCWGRRGRDYWISCLINPSVGREADWGGDKFIPAEVTKTVLVVGGGPAGCEAARVAAERGHRVTLVEAAPDLGGQFRLAGAQPRRAQITDLLDWYARQLDKLGVILRFNSYLDADDIAAEGADVVILATGALPAGTGFQKALPHIAELPGAAQAHSVENVLSRSARLGKQVAVLDEGGGWKGVGTAWHLAEQGHEVTIITPDALVGRDLQRVAADIPARQRLARLGVRFVTETAVTAWAPGRVETLNLLTGKAGTLEVDNLVLSLINVANTELQDDLRKADISPVLVGDAYAPRHAAAAIFEGRKAGLEV